MLVQGRLVILGQAPYGVAYVEIITTQAIGDHFLVKILASLADKGRAFAHFCPAGILANDHKSGRVLVGEDVRVTEYLTLGDALPAKLAHAASHAGTADLLEHTITALVRCLILRCLKHEIGRLR
jgi:hypothetical protein